jgi:hypothetical protein
MSVAAEPNRSACAEIAALVNTPAQTWSLKLEIYLQRSCHRGVGYLTATVYLAHWRYIPGRMGTLRIVTSIAR